MRDKARVDLVSSSSYNKNFLKKNEKDVILIYER